MELPSSELEWNCLRDLVPGVGFRVELPSSESELNCKKGINPNPDGAVRVRRARLTFLQIGGVAAGVERVQLAAGRLDAKHLVTEPHAAILHRNEVLTATVMTRQCRCGESRRHVKRRSRHDALIKLRDDSLGVILRQKFK